MPTLCNNVKELERRISNHKTFALTGAECWSSTFYTNEVSGNNMSLMETVERDMISNIIHLTQPKKNPKST